LVGQREGVIFSNFCMIRHVDLALGTPLAVETEAVSETKKRKSALGLVLMLVLSVLFLLWVDAAGREEPKDYYRPTAGRW